jgi:hypothetical protein
VALGAGPWWGSPVTWERLRARFPSRGSYPTTGGGFGRQRGAQGAGARHRAERTPWRIRVPGPGVWVGLVSAAVFVALVVLTIRWVITP